MFIHHLYKTPLKKKAQTISYETTETNQQTHEQTKFRQKANQLYENFNTLCSTIEVDHNKKHFNLIEYEKEDQKIKYDPQIMNAKLRRLENQAQINRIQMQLEQRRKKRTKSTNRHNQLATNEFQNASYQQTYQSFLKNNKLIQMPQNDSESQEDETQPKPKGISRFHQLKKHSKILEYTMKKMKEKEQENIKISKITDERKHQVKIITNDLKDYGEFQDIVRKKSSSTVAIHNDNPQVIIEDKFKRIMTMKAKDKVSQKVKQNPRCNQMMNLQNDILLKLQEEKKSLSKDNMKKLKSRFIQIVNELHKGDKKRKENKFLPSIQTVSFTANNTARTNKRTSKYRNTLQKLSNTYDFHRNQEDKRLEIRDHHLSIDSNLPQQVEHSHQDQDNLPDQEK